MPQLVLTYFDLDGSRGEVAHLAGIAFEDIIIMIGSTFALEGEAKKKAREALAAGSSAHFLRQFEARLKAGGGEWFVENRLTFQP